MIGEYYKESESVMRVVRIGQDLITKCENNELFAGNDDESYELSEFKSLSQLSSIEKKAVSFYLDNKDA